MKARILAVVLVLSGLFVTTDKSYACGGPGKKAPVAILIVEPEYVAPGRTVILDGSDSYDPDGSIVKYEWDWTNDGSYDYNETSSSHSDGKFDGITTHVYNDPCTYTAKLRVTDNDGADSNDTFTVYVGSVFNVTDGLSYDGIQDAIDEAGENDVIKVYPGRYIETGNINFTSAKITLTSIDPNDPEIVAATIIDGNDDDSVVTFGSGDANSIITGFTITNGEADNGGGIYCDGVSPEINNCVIADNNASYYGGGMCCTGAASQPTITNCVFIENKSGGSYYSYGGGICSNGSASPTITNCFFSKNSTYHGGGLANKNSSPTVVNCVFSKNHAKYCGGGIYDYNSSPTVRNCTFHNNRVAILLWRRGV